MGLWIICKMKTMNDSLPCSWLRDIKFEGKLNCEESVMNPVERRVVTSLEKQVNKEWLRTGRVENER